MSNTTNHPEKVIKIAKQKLFFSHFFVICRDSVKFQENMNHNEFEFTGGEVPLITGEYFIVDPLAAKANFNKAETMVSVTISLFFLCLQNASEIFNSPTQTFRLNGGP